MKENYYTLDETAEMVGATYEMLQYHRRKKHIPPPEKWMGRSVYSASEFEKVKRFFVARKKYEHQKAKVTQ